jgi:hypothetical protein
MIKYLEIGWSFLGILRITEGEGAILTIVTYEICWLLYETEIRAHEDK